MHQGDNRFLLVRFADGANRLPCAARQARMPFLTGFWAPEKMIKLDAPESPVQKLWEKV